jgi:hypothetical protein
VLGGDTLQGCYSQDSLLVESWGKVKAWKEAVCAMLNCVQKVASLISGSGTRVLSFSNQCSSRSSLRPRTQLHIVIDGHVVFTIRVKFKSFILADRRYRVCVGWSRTPRILPAQQCLLLQRKCNISYLRFANTYLRSANSCLRIANC